MMMNYVFVSGSELWTSTDLQELKDFVKRNFEIEVSWMKLEVGEKLVFSECENYSLEKCPSDYKALHQAATIGKKVIPVELQN